MHEEVTCCEARCLIACEAADKEDTEKRNKLFAGVCCMSRPIVQKLRFGTLLAHYSVHAHIVVLFEVQSINFEGSFGASEASVLYDTLFTNLRLSLQM